MTENERLANQLQSELLHAIAKYDRNEYTPEQFLNRLRLIFKAAQL